MHIDRIMVGFHGSKHFGYVYVLQFDHHNNTSFKNNLPSYFGALLRNEIATLNVCRTDTKRDDAGTGFATGHISLGEVDLIQVSTFEEVWSALEGGSDNKGVTLYKPIEVPAGYHVLCHYGQRNSLPRVGWVLAIKETDTCSADFSSLSPESSSPKTLPIEGTPKTSAGLSLSAAEGAAVSGDEAKEDLPSSPSKSKKEIETCPAHIFPSLPASSSPKPIASEETPKQIAGLSLGAAKGAAVSGAGNRDEAEEDSPPSPSKSKREPETCPAHIFPPPPPSSSPKSLAFEETPKKFAGLSLGVAESAAVSGPVSGDEAEDNSPRSPSKSKHSFRIPSLLPALKKPVDFRLVWKSCTWGGRQVGNGWIWLPQPPEGYSTLGYVVTNTEEKPGLDEVTCVRTDLTEACAIDGNIFTTTSSSDEDDKAFVFPFGIWRTRPAVRGISATGVNVGSFYCAQSEEVEDTTSTLPIACLKNVNFKLDAMPTLAQVRSIQQYHGSTLVFHPNEVFLPSSVSWFFEAGAMLYTNDVSNPPPQPIKSDGSNLPQGGTNDGAFWIDLPSDGTKDEVKKGNLESAEAYVHVKPVYGGTFTDLQTWEFCPFNGPSVAKVGKLTIALGHVGEHVSDWEHHTLRISNFTGELEAVYFSQHSGGNWVRPFDLEYVSGNKQVVYVAKNGHPCYPHAGDHLQGDERRGIGLKNDTAMSTLLLDCAEKYQVSKACARMAFNLLNRVRVCGSYPVAFLNRRIIEQTS